jgi:hypothetical protein
VGFQIAPFPAAHRSHISNIGQITAIPLILFRVFLPLVASSDMGEHLRPNNPETASIFFIWWLCGGWREKPAFTMFVFDLLQAAEFKRIKSW